jgi:outer membrane protein OmpA-like peptidoglycan-associated protein
MRQACLLLTALLFAAAPAGAQVTVNLQALDGLGGGKPAAKKPPPHHAEASRTHKRIASTKKSGKPPAQQAAEQPATPPPAAAAAPATQGATQAPPTPPPATLPTAPPATVALAPVPPPPSAPEPVAPPPPPPVSDTAASAATTTGTGLRVTFGAGQSDLSPASAAAIKSVVQSAASGDGTTFNLLAYAAGAPDDPSTARRLSLSRALAVRSALMADGIASSRIYVRALGAAGGDEAPDRVDLAVMGGNSPATSPASVPAPDDATPKSQSQ